MLRLTRRAVVAAAGVVLVLVVVWYVITSQPAIRLTLPSSGIFFHTDGHTFLAATAEGLTVWSWPDVMQIRQININGAPGWTTATWSTDGNYVALEQRGKTLEVWDLATGTHISTLSGCPRAISWLAQDSDGNRRIVCDNGDVYTYRNSYATVPKYMQLPSGSRPLALSATGRLIALATREGIRILNIEDLSLRQTIRLPESTLIQVATFSHTEHLLAVAVHQQEGEMITLWRVDDGTPLGELVGHQDQINTIVFSASDMMVIAAGGALHSGGSNDSTVRVWDVATTRLFRTFAGHTKSVTSLALSADQTTIASTGWDRTIRFWSLPTE